MKNREIKFRAWDKNKDKMFYIGDKARWVKEGTITNGDLLDWFEDEDLMQFIGLLDKNGKEIYEGDILGQKDYSTIVVGWYRNMFVTYFIEDEICDSNPIYDLGGGYEVIGNIYENKELLK